MTSLLSPSAKFYMLLYGDPEDVASVVAGFDEAVNEMADGAQLGCIPVDG